jgi:type IV pilus assembly protein PilV
MHLTRKQGGVLHPKPRRVQRGLSLIEAMVALVILALGILSLAGVQARILVESRTTNSRATAVGLMDDLANRMLLNRDAAIANSYALAWGATKAAQDCATAQCTGAQLAQSDLNFWRARVIATLPSANTTVFQSATDPRQIGIAIAWRANESKASDADSATYVAPFGITAANSGVDCPANFICHLVYVQP